MSEIRREPYASPAAWLAADMRKTSDWIYHVTDSEIAELDAALRQVKARGLAFWQVTKADFPLPGFSRRIADIVSAIEKGRGFALVRGIPVQHYSKEDAQTIYWGIGAHIGTGQAQNAKGDLIGHVRHEGGDYKKDNTSRGYNSKSSLDFHSDSSDIVGLLCLRPAKSGGLSSIVSSVSLFNAIVTRRPDLVDALYQPCAMDMRGEEPAGHPPYYLMPIYMYYNNELFAQYIGAFARSSARLPGVPKLHPAQLEAMDLIDSLAASDEFRLDMDFRLGDIQFLNNYSIFHARSEFEDYEEPDRKRHLLRLWMDRRPTESLPPPIRHRRFLTHAWAKPLKKTG